MPEHEPDPSLVAEVDTAIGCEAKHTNGHDTKTCDEAARYAVQWHNCNVIMLCPACYGEMVTALYPVDTAECHRCHNDFTPGMAMVTGVSEL